MRHSGHTDTLMQDMLMAASSEIPNLRSSLSGRVSLERGRSARQSVEVPRLPSTDASAAPKVPLLTIQQAESEDSRDLAEEKSGPLNSHRVSLSLLHFSLWA